MIALAIVALVIVIWWATASKQKALVERKEELETPVAVTTIASP